MNTHAKIKTSKVYDLEDRLIDFAVMVIDITEELPQTKAGNHIAGQLVRAGTSPASNYGEAQSAESRKDFIHKIKVCLKELKETRVWLTIISKRSMISIHEKITVAKNECEELIKIAYSSVATARTNSVSP